MHSQPGGCGGVPDQLDESIRAAVRTATGCQRIGRTAEGVRFAGIMATIPLDTSRQLDETLSRLSREHVLVIELTDLADLLVEPHTGPFVPQRGPIQPGIVDLATTLAAAKAATKRRATS